MYRFKPVLRIPGPVPVPNEVSLQMAKPMINHTLRSIIQLS
jgi:aspartate aminotransferase-like enzyme